ncbi:MAG TPA: ergothioneine biosynthesis protein EgtB [Planctomycetota bacterium]
MSLASALRRVRAATLTLVRPLGPEDCAIQSDPDVSPAKWHLAHTTWFFETFVLLPHAPGYRAFHPAFGFLFNSYYETVGERHERPRRGQLSRPDLETVLAYRAHVDQALDGLLAAAAPPLAAVLAPLLELGLQHEQQHQELLLMDIKHVLGTQPLRPAYRQDLPQAARCAAAPLDWIELPGGQVRIGHDGRGFAFDNELPKHAALVPPHALASRPATCGDYLAFLADDGYRRADLWLADGWDFAQRHRWEAPLYWQRDAAGAWLVYTLGGLRELREEEPVCHLSFYEADAFARWSGARLPTEHEWEAAARPAWPGAPSATTLHPEPAPHGAGLQQLHGTVWEWTASAYLPYPGFQPLPGSLGEYNGKFMSGQMVLRGGCCATPAGHARPSYRNSFQPGKRWPFTGMRLARDL